MEHFQRPNCKGCRDSRRAQPAWMARRHFVRRCLGKLLQCAVSRQNVAIPLVVTFRPCSSIWSQPIDSTSARNPLQSLVSFLSSKPRCVGVCTPTTSYACPALSAMRLVTSLLVFHLVFLACVSLVAPRFSSASTAPGSTTPMPRGAPSSGNNGKTGNSRDAAGVVVPGLRRVVAHGRIH